MTILGQWKPEPLPEEMKIGAAVLADPKLGPRSDRFTPLGWPADQLHYNQESAMKLIDQKSADLAEYFLKLTLKATHERP